jgi:serine/threonine-protein kinase
MDRNDNPNDHFAATVDANNLLGKECPVCGACFDSSAQFCPEHNSEKTVSLPVQYVIEGRYRLIKQIGKGGMGAVYEAVDLPHNRLTAIKIILGAFFDQETVRRFEREARASEQLRHPNIVAVYGYGQIGTRGAYLIMERVQGATLRALLNQQEKIRPDIAADWFDQLLEGLKVAHQAGIIHRDLKPENVFIAPQPNGKDLITRSSSFVLN